MVVITVFLYRIVRVAERRINWCRSARYKQAKAANSSRCYWQLPAKSSRWRQIKITQKRPLKGGYESRAIQPLPHGLPEEPIGNILEVCSYKLPCWGGVDG